MKNFRFVFLILSLLSTSGCASRASDGAPVARFDGAQVTDKEFLRRASVLPPEAKSYVQSHKREFLDDMVAEHFLLKEARKRGIEKDPEVKQVLEAAERKIVISRLVQKEIDEKVDVADADIEKYYADHQDEFMTPLTLRASHILVKTEEEASLIKSQIESGADFEEMARRNSLDATAIRGGDLGFFQKGRFVPEFEEAVFSMKKGEVRGPVKSQFGYHVIRLTDRLEPTLRSFRDVRSFVKQRLVAEKRSKAFHDLVNRLQGNTRVDVDDKKLEGLSLSA